MDLLSRAVTAFSPGYRVGTTIPGLKVEPSVLGHRAGTKEGPLVPVGVPFLTAERGGGAAARMSRDRSWRFVLLAVACNCIGDWERRLWRCVTRPTVCDPISPNPILALPTLGSLPIAFASARDATL